MRPHGADDLSEAVDNSPHKKSTQMRRIKFLYVTRRPEFNRHERCTWDAEAGAPFLSLAPGFILPTLPSRPQQIVAKGRPAQWRDLVFCGTQSAGCPILVARVLERQSLP